MPHCRQFPPPLSCHLECLLQTPPNTSNTNSQEPENSREKSAAKSLLGPKPQLLQYLDTDKKYLQTVATAVADSRIEKSSQS